MNQMVNRVADEINGMIANLAHPVGMGIGLPEKAALAIAVCAIAAMREPTPEMIEAMEREIGNGIYIDGYESTGYYAAYLPSNPAAPFAAAIDAALSPSSPSDSQ